MDRKKYETIHLNSENSSDRISMEDQNFREFLMNEFRGLPKELFIYLRHFQPQVGCLNSCGFCSQETIGDIWSLSQNALKNIFAAIKAVAIEVASTYITKECKPYLTSFCSSDHLNNEYNFSMPEFGLVAYGRLSHRPGVIYPYLDNDIASYPYLFDYLKFANEDLGVKVRLSTVGFSRHNTCLQKMHERINKECLDSIGGLRLSLTPYAIGWTDKGEKSGLTSRDEFVNDIENFLRTYIPIVKHLGVGDRAACVEFKFPPLVVKTEVDDRFIDNHHIIHAGPYLLISKSEYNEKPEMVLARIKSDQRHQTYIDTTPKIYLVIVSEELRSSTDWLEITKKILSNGINKIDSVLSKFIVRQGKLYLFENDEGVYYGVDPGMTEQGFNAKQFYPITERRPVSGYIDSERYFLNTIVGIKHDNFLGRRDQFPDANWEDVDRVIHSLGELAESLNHIDHFASCHIIDNILPLVESYRIALESATYPASYFFDKGFTIDTGEICNLGRVYSEYKGITSRRDSVVTPQHERVYGTQSSLVHEGTTWRISVSPINKRHAGKAGKRSVSTLTSSLLIEEFSLSKLTSFDGEVLRRWFIPLRSEDIEHIDKTKLQKIFLIPGQI